jgi:hypothetical protein
MLRVFLTAFGLSEPKPGQENKAALFLFGTLGILALLLAGAVWTVLELTGSR